MHKICSDLLPLALPIGEFEGLPGNPRRGKVEAVAESLDRFGQFKAVVYKRNPATGKLTILAGNTTWRGALKLGWDMLAGAEVETDDKESIALALADNRTHDVGGYDNSDYADMLSAIADDDALLSAAGHDLLDLEDFKDSIMPDLDIEFDRPEAEPKPVPKPVLSATIVFTSEEEQESWFRLVRWLKREYPDLLTLSERLHEYISSIEPR